MPSYDASSFDPPAPVASVTLRSQDGGAIVHAVVMLVDTGSDVTLLPHVAVDRLGVLLLAGQSYELVGFDGSRSFAPVVTLDMVFLNRAFRGRYLLIEDDRGILGRDVLNHVKVLLDGPRREWSDKVS